jgi:hypothetical protein
MKKSIFLFLGLILFFFLSYWVGSFFYKKDEVLNKPEITLEGLKLQFHNPEYNFQWLRTLAASSAGAADIGEVLITSSKIKEGDDESWFHEWNLLAERCEKLARDYTRNGHLESARTAFARASNYYRTAEFFLHVHPQDPRILQTFEKSKACFLESVKDLSQPVLEVQIPFENTFLPAYLCLPDTSQKKRPLIIIQTGFDGTKEELYYTMGKEAVKRGYICLLFEGPGQGEVIRKQHIPFRPNWESVITPVVDYALNIPEVDSSKIALMGRSFGGYLVPRALCFEKRIQLGIANGGIYDFHEICMQGGSHGLEQGLYNPKACQEIDKVILEMMKTKPDLRWVFGQGMYVFQAKTPTEWLKMTGEYTMKNIVSNISTPMLIVDSENDVQMKGQAKKLYDNLSSPKEFMLFTNEEGAGEHCQEGALFLSNERVFNFIDQFFSS